MHRICVLLGFYAAQVGSCYQPALPKIPEERRSHSHRGVTLKSHKNAAARYSRHVAFDVSIPCNINSSQHSVLNQIVSFPHYQHFLYTLTSVYMKVHQCIQITDQKEPVECRRSYEVSCHWNIFAV